MEAEQQRVLQVLVNESDGLLAVEVNEWVLRRRWRMGDGGKNESIVS